jgi:hypothetical protein
MNRVPCTAAGFLPVFCGAMLAASVTHAAVLLKEGFDTYPVQRWPAAWTLLYEGAGRALQVVDSAQSASGPSSLTLTGSP